MNGKTAKKLRRLARLKQGVEERRIITPEGAVMHVGTRKTYRMLKRFPRWYAASRTSSA